MTEEESHSPEKEHVDDTEKVDEDDAPEQPESPPKETQDASPQQMQNLDSNHQGLSGMDSEKLAETLEGAPEAIAQNELIANSTPKTPLEIVLACALSRKEIHITRLKSEVDKLKEFVSKRKQTYKRKRKDEGAPTRALSAYNIFIQVRIPECY